MLQEFVLWFQPMNTAIHSVGAGRFYFFGFPMPLAEEGLRAY